MASRWVKAVFLTLLAIVLALYVDKFITDLENALVNDFSVEFDWTWQLLTILLWILVAWLFVLAGLTIALSLKEDMYTIGDVIARLRAIEKKLGMRQAKPHETAHHEEPPEIPVPTEPVEVPQEEEVPPPPRE